MNIVRGKTETAEGRFTEISLPVDDMNWGLLPSPKPELAVQPPQPGALDPANPAPPVDPKDEAKKKCSAMQLEIADQLDQCSFNAECRKVTRQSAKLGTGVLKGPNVIKTAKRAWVGISDGMETAHVLKVVEEMKPSSKWVDIWDIYPDPWCEGNVSKLSYIWERGGILPRELRALMGLPGYNVAQIRKVLEQDPIRTTVAQDKGGVDQRITTIVKKGAPYERWEYHGEVDAESLISIGCQCPEGVKTVSACVVFVNDLPIRVQLNTLDSGELPYDFFQWVPVEGSLWGDRRTAQDALAAARLDGGVAHDDGQRGGLERAANRDEANR